MADRKKAQRTLAKSLKDKSYEPSSIGAKARAAANKLKTAATGGKHSKPGPSDTTRNSDVSIGKHSKETAPSGGKHRAATSAQSAKKNASGDLNAPAKGKHAKSAAMSQSDAMAAHSKHRNSGKPAEKTLVRPAKTTGSSMSLKEAVNSRRKARNKFM